MNKELINKMKMCLLCRDSEEWPYTESAAIIHNQFDLHFDKGKTYAPIKGHSNYDLHLKMVGLWNDKYEVPDSREGECE